MDFLLISWQDLGDTPTGYFRWIEAEIQCDDYCSNDLETAQIAFPFRFFLFLCVVAIVIVVILSIVFMLVLILVRW